ncbi:ABC transporter permease [Brooklawnia cerclae]|uniref:Peptide/nickel transport system permease protein n=1 Tax=Brooklawnia cerclae TaxID=349934 RepID=A0ABX0SCD0_9ACTN|nr:peptide/nickel transport system permease protein [Brooklawnia cerclae]
MRSLRSAAARTAAIIWWLLVWAAWTLAALVVVFLLLDALPGDAASARLGQYATPEALTQLRAQYGLDRPVLERLANWLRGLASGDLGTTLLTNTQVAPILTSALGRTALLAALASIGIMVLGWGGAILAGSRSGSVLDRVLSSSALAAICTPEFVVATLLIVVFASVLGWLPAVSLVPADGGVLAHPEILVLPTLSIVIVGSGTLMRLVRPVIARQSVSLHVEAARLAGLSPARVLLRHLLPGAIAPAAQASAMIVPYLVGGTVVIERAFAYPGLGSLMVQAVSNREPDLLMACAGVVIALTVLAYRLADLSRGKTS